MSIRVMIWAFVVACIGSPVFGLGGPENVLVVRNGNSPVSMRVAAYYASARSIPVGNIVTISTIDSSLSATNEAISPTDYTNLIEQPVRTFMASHSLTNHIQYIVLTKGIPIRLSSDPTGGQTGPQSVDSMLAGMDLNSPVLIQFTDFQQQVTATAYANQFWRSQAPFSHSARGGYLVTRLDGYTESDAKTLVDRGLATPGRACYLLDVDANKGTNSPALQPRSLLLPDDVTLDPNYRLDYADFNADMVKATQIIAARPGLMVTLDTSSTFVGSSDRLTGYVSWGSNDGHFDKAVYNAFTFAPRSIAETAVSTSGRTFFPTTSGQSLIADLISQGVAGAKGYVSEPYLDAIASPSVLLDFYTSGRNLAESFYAASRFIKWKDLVLGDPLTSLPGTSVSTIGAALRLPEGTLVSLAAKPVTAGTDDFGDRFYIEEPNRVSGILVYIGQQYAGVPRGAVVTVRGLLGTLNGERCIFNPSIISPELSVPTQGGAEPQQPPVADNCICVQPLGPGI